MISVKDFLKAVEEIANENPTYRNGGTGADGTCDCIGLIIGAMRRCGHGEYALHGSNSFARNETDELDHVDAAEKGMIVYKCRAPGDSGYDLPERYQPGGAYWNGDLLDYYHVGVVTGVCPIEITHCTSSGSVNGIKRDTTEREYRSWKTAGYLKDVDYEGGRKPVTERKGTVKTQDGNPAKLRKDPSTKNPYIAKVPDGAEITVYESTGDWSAVGWNGKRGYMMSRFVELGQPQGAAQGGGGCGHSLDELYEMLAEIRALLAGLPCGGEEGRSDPSQPLSPQGEPRGTGTDEDGKGVDG